MHNSLSWRNKNKRHAQLIRYSISCCSYHAFLDRGLLLARFLLNQIFLVVKLKSSRLTFTEYPCLKLPRICSVFCNHNRLLFSFIIYNRVCNKSNTTSVTCGSRNCVPAGAPEFTPSSEWGSYCSIFSFLCSICRSLFVPFLWSFNIFLHVNRKLVTVVVICGTFQDKNPTVIQNLLF